MLVFLSCEFIQTVLTQASRLVISERSIPGFLILCLLFLFERRQFLYVSMSYLNSALLIGV